VLQIAGGIACDFFEALQGDKNSDLESSSAVSYNFNMGFAYRYYFSNNSYIGLKAKNNIVDYTFNNVVDLPGRNTVSIQFSLGVLINRLLICCLQKRHCKIIRGRFLI
jgi:hypothetical protein